VGVQAQAVRDHGFLVPAPPVKMVAAPASTHGVIPLRPDYVLNHLRFGHLSRHFPRRLVAVGALHPLVERRLASKKAGKPPRQDRTSVWPADFCKTKPIQA